MNEDNLRSLLHSMTEAHEETLRVLQNLEKRIKVIEQAQKQGFTSTEGVKNES